MAASHSGEDMHVRTLQAVFRRATLSQTLLACGDMAPLDALTAARLARDGEAPGPIRHMCSGFHAASICSAGTPAGRSTTTGGPTTPARWPPGTRWPASSGCARPPWSRPGTTAASRPTPSRSSRSPARTRCWPIRPAWRPVTRGAASSPALTRIRDAMLAAPEMVGGSRDRLDTALTVVGARRMVAKSGAEGLRGVALLPEARGPRSERGRARDHDRGWWRPAGQSRGHRGGRAPARGARRTGTSAAGGVRSPRDARSAGRRGGRGAPWLRAGAHLGAHLIRTSDTTMPPIPDPYRVLGVAREATVGEIRTAHRRLAKQYHPDATGGDTERFLAVQEAYQVLSDPLRRREWDARHRPGPVRADTSPRTRPTATRGGTARGATTARGQAQASPAGDGNTAAAGPRPARGSRTQTNRQRRRPDPFSPSGREPTSDSYTWSAQDVPWWSSGPDRIAAGAGRGRLAPGHDRPAPTPPLRRPRARPRQPPARRIVPARRAPTSTSTTDPPAPPGRWPRGPTSAARDRTCRAARPSRSASAGRPRRARRRAGPDPARPPPVPRPPHRAPLPPPAVPTRVRITTRASRAPRAPRRPWAGRAAWSSAPLAGPRPGGGAGGRQAWPSVGGRLLYAVLGWLAPAAVLTLGPFVVAMPVVTGVLSALAVALLLAPRLAYLAAVGGTAALVAGAGLALGQAASADQLGLRRSMPSPRP